MYGETFFLPTAIRHQLITDAIVDADQVLHVVGHVLPERRLHVTWVLWVGVLNLGAVLFDRIAKQLIGAELCGVVKIIGQVLWEAVLMGVISVFEKPSHFGLDLGFDLIINMISDHWGDDLSREVRFKCPF